MGSMGKGQVWINGQSIGRYWPALKASGSCGGCSYAGTYNEKKCQSNCWEASQKWYHVPWLNPTGNLIVVFEEWGGDPKWISMVKRTVGCVCADIAEWQPANWHIQEYVKLDPPQRPKAHLWCSPGQKITFIKFARSGTPQGVCGSFAEGNCPAHRSYDAFQKLHHLFLSLHLHCLSLHHCGSFLNTKGLRYSFGQSSFACRLYKLTG